MNSKIHSLLAQLNQGLVSREQVLKMGLLTLLSGENLVLVGPPGTGKSLVARRIAKSLADDTAQAGKADYFEYLLTKFSTPEEIFGPLSISALKADQFKRNTEGYLPTVRMAFLDEIFKASSSILNALLTILNERVYHNGAQTQAVPLRALIAASNELPNDQEELSALYDRFLVRVFVDYVGLSQLPQLFEPTTEPELKSTDLLTVQDLANIQHSAQQVTIAPELVDAVQAIWGAHQEAFKEDRRESLSDRRLKKIIHLLRVSATTNGRTAVDLSDLVLLKDCLWNHPDNAEKVRELILRTLQNHSRAVPLTGADTAAPSANTATKSTQPASAQKKSGKAGAVVKGYKGSGTADDPLLIETAEDLADLARPDAGQQGYHFRQTADLDISHISTWPEIVFKGHYDGGMHEIKSGTKGVKRGYNGSIELVKEPLQCCHFLFEMVTQSVMTKMVMKGCGLAGSVEKQSEITHCTSSIYLAFILTDSKISACESLSIAHTATSCSITSCISQGSIIDIANSCQIERCESHGPLILQKACDSGIKDNLVVLQDYEHPRPTSGAPFGGVVTRVENSNLSNCFVLGNNVRLKYDGSTSNSNFFGISSQTDSSTVKHCAVGSLNLTSPKDYRDARFILRGRISANSKDSVFEKNIAIDSVIAKDDGIHGESIAPAVFKQRYFEYTLGWDFETVWEWNKKENRPALRQVGVQAAVLTPTQPAADPNTVDLLTQQVQANIWL